MSDPTLTSGQPGAQKDRALLTYSVGFVGSVILTAAAFFLVMRLALTPVATTVTIVALAFAQILIQLFFFLHLGTSPEKRWNLAALVYVLIIIVIVTGGSLWIMNSSNYLMMPH